MNALIAPCSQLHKESVVSPSIHQHSLKTNPATRAAMSDQDQFGNHLIVQPNNDLVSPMLPSSNDVSGCATQVRPNQQLKNIPAGSLLSPRIKPLRDGGGGDSTVSPVHKQKQQAPISPPSSTSTSSELARTMATEESSSLRKKKKHGRRVRFSPDTMTTPPARQEVRRHKASRPLSLGRRLVEARHVSRTALTTSPLSRLRMSPLDRLENRLVYKRALPRHLHASLQVLACRTPNQAGSKKSNDKKETWGSCMRQQNTSVLRMQQMLGDADSFHDNSAGRGSESDHSHGLSTNSSADAKGHRDTNESGEIEGRAAEDQWTDACALPLDCGEAKASGEAPCKELSQSNCGRFPSVVKQMLFNGEAGQEENENDDCFLKQSGFKPQIPVKENTDLQAQYVGTGIKSVALNDIAQVSTLQYNNCSLMQGGENDLDSNALLLTEEKTKIQISRTKEDQTYRDASSCASGLSASYGNPTGGDIESAGMNPVTNVLPTTDLLNDMQSTPILPFADGLTIEQPYKERPLSADCHPSLIKRTQTSDNAQLYVVAGSVTPPLSFPQSIANAVDKSKGNDIICTTSLSDGDCTADSTTALKSKSEQEFKNNIFDNYDRGATFECAEENRDHSVSICVDDNPTTMTANNNDTCHPVSIANCSEESELAASLSIFLPATAGTIVTDQDKEEVIQPKVETDLESLTYFPARESSYKRSSRRTTTSKGSVGMQGPWTRLRCKRMSRNDPSSVPVSLGIADRTRRRTSARLAGASSAVK